MSNYPYKFYVFGSRATGRARRLSDLDLCYKQDIPDSTLSYIKEEFEESNLPFTVDIVNWNTISEDFRNLIKKDLTVIN